MSASPARILMVFLDGVGIGAPDPEVNPFAAARLPRLEALLGGRLPLHDAAGRAVPLTTDAAVLVPADATLGVDGRPQSGTGQTTLLTGTNAAARFGRHFGAWVPTTLRTMLAERSVLARVERAGGRASFANAYPLDIAERLLAKRPIAPPFAARAAGVLNRGAEALAARQAVASSIVNAPGQARVGADVVPAVTPSAAGGTLARLSAEADLTLFAHYDTDLAGHRGGLAGGIAAIERVDAFLGGVLDALPRDTLLVITSDHGNLEDATTGHTTNPVPVIAVGPGRETLAARVRSLTDITPALLELLRID
jgi:hypothetical protein